MSVFLSFCLSVCLPVCLSACLSVCLSIRPSVRPSVCPSVRLSVCLSVCLSVHLSVCLCLHVCMNATCLLANFTLDSTYFPSARFGEGSGPVFIDYINCDGSESRLWGSPIGSQKTCLSFSHYYGCSHSSDVGVRCQPGIMLTQAKE